MPLVDDLRYIVKYVTAMTFQVKETCGDAANEIERLQRERDGWQKTALALRDAAIYWDKDGVNRYERIERMYFDAAMSGRFPETYHDKQTEDAALA